MNIKIYTVYHKKFHAPHSSEIQPIQVGNLAPFGEPFLRDNTGINISDKNDTHCEITALYWIRHNDKFSDYIGLMHYRRWFDFNGKGKERSTNYHAITDWDSFTKNFLKDLGLESENIKSFVKNVDIVLPEAWNTQEDLVRNVYEQYKSAQRISDFEMALEITEKLYPEYRNTIVDLKNSNYMYTTNMFLMKSALFREYVDWLMPILDSLTSKIDFSNLDTQTKRAPGYIAERLFTLWIMKNKNKYRIKYAPRIFIKNLDQKEKKDQLGIKLNIIKGKIRRFRKILSYKVFYLWRN